MNSKSVVFVADDDLAFNKLMDQVLKKYGLRSVSFSSAQSLLEKLASQLPTLFLIDLNLGAPRSGFDLIKTIREKFTLSVPIFIVSTNTDLEAISHALEIGANDYLFKPLNREVLISKLQNHVQSPELEFALPGAARSPDSAVTVSALFDSRVDQIDEAGIMIVTRHLMPKGTVVTMTGGMIDEILGKSSHILATVISSTVEKNEDRFQVYLEFDSAQKPIADQVRNWIVQRKEKSRG